MVANLLSKMLLQKEKCFSTCNRGTFSVCRSLSLMWSEQLKHKMWGAPQWLAPFFPTSLSNRVSRFGTGASLQLEGTPFGRSSQPVASSPPSYPPHRWISIPTQPQYPAKANVPHCRRSSINGVNGDWLNILCR